MPACKERRSFSKMNGRFSVLNNTGFIVCSGLDVVFFIRGIGLMDRIDHFQELALDGYGCFHLYSMFGYQSGKNGFEFWLMPYGRK